MGLKFLSHTHVYPAFVIMSSAIRCNNINLLSNNQEKLLLKVKEELKMKALFTFLLCCLVTLEVWYCH